jgi:acyl-CoA thioester hydrolase
VREESGFRHKLRVRYQETDQMGVVYHANYLSWFEIGRTEWIRQLGVTYAQLEEADLLLPVTDVQVKYISPARYDDEVCVHVQLVECSHVRIGFRYEIRRNDSRELLVTGTTRHVWVNEHWKPTRLDKVNPELYEQIKAEITH